MNKLDIVNHMLFTVGEQIQNTLETLHPSVLQALQILDSNDDDFQGRGWWFNTENSTYLEADGDGFVQVPPGQLSVEVIAQAGAPIANKAQYAVRGSKLYDTVNHTFVIGLALLTNVVVQQPIEDLPHNAATYLKHLAAEAMYTADDGDQVKMGRLQEKTALAWHVLKAEELKVANINALNAPAAAHLRYRMQQGLGSTNPNRLGGR